MAALAHSGLGNTASATSSSTRRSTTSGDTSSDFRKFSKNRSESLARKPFSSTTCPYDPNSAPAL
eukprot:1160922-Prorocentrum_minimum.AAC.4